MKALRRKVILPVFRLTELANKDDPQSFERTIKQGKENPSLTYYYRFVWDENEDRGYNYNLFPVVLDKNSAPWTYGMLFILSQLEGESLPVMSSSHSSADDLAAFKEWLDTQDKSDEILFNFPKAKLQRTTYRFRGYLMQQIQAREISPVTANRRISTVIRFYRWLIANKFFTPDYPPWGESEHRLSYFSKEGRQLSTVVTSTSLSIPAPKMENNFEGLIKDGGTLRPLTIEQQNWVIEAAELKGNSECLLLQLFMLGTGARIESACTLRVRHFLEPEPQHYSNLTGVGEVYRLKAGPGTGIETKNNKSGTFQIPSALYKVLHTYALSKRAELRRECYLVRHGVHSDPYLFITGQGSPYYQAKADAQSFNPKLDRRYIQNGQAVRQFIKEQAIPYINERYDKTFQYRAHDLRASFGMNMTELLMALVQKKQITSHAARLMVRDLMWHSSLNTTDLYLDYKSSIAAIFSALDGYGQHLEGWTLRAMQGLNSDDE